MSSWLRWVNNAAANFNLSQSIRAASGRFMDRNRKHMREECDKSDQHVESSQSSKSIIKISDCASTTCACASSSTSCGRDTCGCGASCAKSCASAKCNSVPQHNDGCSCNLCTAYAEYIASGSAKGKGTDPRARISNESRSIKQTNADATSSVEYRTGIPTGTAI